MCRPKRHRPSGFRSFRPMDTSRIHRRNLLGCVVLYTCLAIVDNKLNWGETNYQVYPFISRPLFYLHCTQIGMFPTGVNARSLFGTAVGQDMYFYGCTEAFGDGYDYMLLADNVEQLRLQYGGKNPAITNAIFTNGELDTHFAFGVTANNEESGMFVRTIPGKYFVFFMFIEIYLFSCCLDHARSADLWSVSDQDSAELASTKLQIRQLVLEWSGVVA